MLALLLRQKRIMDVNALDQYFAFAVHGFVPGFLEKEASAGGGGASSENNNAATSNSNSNNNSNTNNSNSNNDSTSLSKATSHCWVFADLDAMKYLLFNHQVWNLSGGGTELP